VVLAKPGLDGHTRGIQHVARSLREAGVEVIYLGLYQTPETIARTAVEEDADAVGISVLSGSPVVGFCRRLQTLLAEAGAGDVAILIGGIIRPDEAAELKRLGVEGIFGPGTAIQSILDHLRAQTVGRHAFR
jgi:methylmalonyl-CoA mutase C-terminal domain/subunit